MRLLFILSPSKVTNSINEAFKILLAVDPILFDAGGFKNQDNQSMDSGFFFHDSEQNVIKMHIVN